MILKNPKAIAISTIVFFGGLVIMALVPEKSIMHTFGGGVFALGIIFIAIFGSQEFKKPDNGKHQHNDKINPS